MFRLLIPTCSSTTLAIDGDKDAVVFVRLRAGKVYRVVSMDRPAKGKRRFSLEGIPGIVILRPGTFRLARRYYNELLRDSAN
jgi:hypothetical protein